MTRHMDLRSTASAETTLELSRFWNRKGERPLGCQAAAVAAAFTELRGNFLAYVDERYGSESRAVLEKQINKSLNDRLGYWLCRSLRFRDARACRALLAMSVDRDPLNVCGTALGHCASTVRQRLSSPSAASSP